MNKRKLFIVIILIMIDKLLLAQMPNTSLYYLKCKKSKNAIYLSEAPIKIHSNQEYNNQAFFIDNNNFLYVKSDSNINTDIWLMNCTTFKERQITFTLHEQEYSPTLLPNFKSLSTVRIDADKKQRLYQINLEGNVIQCYNDSLTDIGYHTWINDTLYVGFFIGDTEKLYLKSTKKYSQWICDKPGRGFKYIKAENKLYFIDKSNDEKWMLKSYDLKNQSEQLLTEMPKGVEDLTLLNWKKKQFLICAFQNVILYYDIKNNTFEPLFDTAITEGNITRIAVNKNSDKMIVVLNKK